eukprot:INCI6107.2.p3 GENE.INCI6107.2~~INCI6107.2.p3  ORF type:complete len:102 (-),score=26.61 INCI6107.2:26-331(-)
MQKEHRQQLVQIVKEEGRKRKFGQDHYALQYKHDEIMAAIAQRTDGGSGGPGGAGGGLGSGSRGGGAGAGAGAAAGASASGSVGVAFGTSPWSASEQGSTQ